MENKPKSPASGVGKSLSGNGVRVRWENGKVTLHDVIDAWWAELRTRIAADGQICITANAIQKHPSLVTLLTRQAFELDGRKDIPVDELVAVVTTGDRGEPGFRSPDLQQVKRAAKRRFSSPDSQGDEERDVMLLATIAASLACMGGMVTSDLLKHDLFRRFGSMEDVQAAIRVALRSKRIERLRVADIEHFSMQPDWDAPSPIPGMPSQTSLRTATPSESSLFDDED